ncbi:hypothetical protein PTKIN_Ptkin15bG0192000 [Pterospermum kingtungense]
MDQSMAVEEVQVVLEVVRKHEGAVVEDLVDGGDEVEEEEEVQHSTQDVVVVEAVHHTSVAVVVQKDLVVAEVEAEAEVVQKGLVVVVRVGGGAYGMP